MSVSNSGKDRVIILSAGKIDYTHLPLPLSSSNGMIPVGGKPVISWIIENLEKRNTGPITIVCKKEDTHLRRFVENRFQKTMPITIKAIDSNSILESLKYAIEDFDSDGQVQIILGDTLIREEWKDFTDYLFVKRVHDSERWCLAELDDRQKIAKFRDKEPDVEGEHLAVCGFYSLGSSETLLECVNSAINNGDKQISSALELYMSAFPLRVVEISEWFDFGNLDNLLSAKRNLIQSRHFNSLTVNPVLGTITKKSEWNEKLELELKWYEALPNSLKVLTPRIIDKKRTNGSLEIVQEYYGYPTLAELFLFTDLEMEIWDSILERLIEIHKHFLQHSSETAVFEQVYIDKTRDRLKEFRDTDEWSELLQLPSLIINGKSQDGYKRLEDKVLKFASHISQKKTDHVIHGDFCFSNILYDIYGSIVRLIDPRGSFGIPGIYGDPRYDIAKIRHCTHGRYDFIANDLFEITGVGNEFELTIFSHESHHRIARIMDDKISSIGYDLNEIIFIEGLLFLTMIPLHKDNKSRQLAMYIQAINLLNEVDYENCN